MEPLYAYVPVAGVERLARRQQADIRAVVIHRIQVSLEASDFDDSPAEIARFFREHPLGRSATGGDMPYPVLIDPDGRVLQTVPLRYITPHARHLNPTSIGLACIGDFRATPMASQQQQSLVNVCTAAVRAFALDAQAVVGHDELGGSGTRDPDKECPGRHVSMDALREAVHLHLQQSPRPAAGADSGLELVW